MLCFSLPASSEDWPQWRGPRGDGTWQAPAIPDTWPAGGLPPVWKAKIGPGYAGIAVSSNRLITMDRPATPVDSERIVCLNAATGEQLWEYVYLAPYGKLDYGKGPRCTPTIFDGRVYTLGSMGHVQCLDAASGKVLWSKDLVRDFSAELPTWGFSASAVIHGDKVIFHAGLPRGAYIAFDRRTGQELWRGGPDPTGYGTPIIIRHGNNERLIGWTPEHILSLSLLDGTELWRVPYKVTYGVSIATPIFHEQTVLVCGYWAGSKAIKLGNQPTSAELLWEENKFLRGLMSQPLYRDGHVYLLDKHHGLICFRLTTGEMVWTDENKLTPRDRNPQANLVWLGDTDRIIALNANGELILARLSPTGYSEQSRTKVIGETWAHPAFAGSFAFARDDEQIVAVRIEKE